MFKSRPSDQEPLVLLVPGPEDIGPGHWQDIWANEDPNCRRVDLGDWDNPQRNSWVNRLNLAIDRAQRKVILVGHSLGCMTVAWWAHLEKPSWGDPVIGALLVAPPEVDFFPRDERLSKFAPTPVEPLPFPSIVVASQNDDWAGQHTARWLAKHWESQFVDAGKLGHINAASGVGRWTAGRQLLASLRARAEEVSRRAEELASRATQRIVRPVGLV